VPFLFVVVVLIVRGGRISFKALVSERLPSVGSGRVRWWAVVADAVVVWALVWFLFDSAWTDAAIVAACVAMVLLSAVVVTGYAGQLSLMQYTFAGLGAWVAGGLVALAGLPFWLAVIAGAVAALPIGLLAGLPAARVRGVSLAVVTIGLAVSVDAVLFSNLDLTGGFGGFKLDRPTLFGWDIGALVHPERYFTVCVVAFVVLALVVANVRRGAAGRRMLSVRSNERAAMALGVNVRSAKLYAFVLGAGIAAVGGALLAFRNSRLSFVEFNSQFSMNAIAESVVGGVGWITGPVLGGQLHSGSLGGSVLDLLLGDAGRWLPLVGGVLLLVIIVTNQDGLASVNAAHLRKLFRLRDRPPAVEQLALLTRPDDEAGAAGALEVRDLRVTFGGVHAVDGVDLDVRPGEIVGLIGPNGAGKSTVIEAVSGFAVAGGTVTLAGESLRGLRPHERARRGVGRSFQALELFEDLTVLENLMAASDRHGFAPLATDIVAPGRRALSASAVRAVGEFGLAEYLHLRPDQLPFGVRRIVAIARAVAADPAVLMLDEPAAGLGEVEKRELATLLRALVADGRRGILLVEHDLGLVMELCDRVVALEFGRMIASGPPAEVRAHPEVIRSYIGAEDGASAQA
jgi:sulfate-transporting ATPase